LGCKKVKSHFCKRHGAQTTEPNTQLAFLYHKFLEKPTFALNLNLAAILDFRIKMRSDHKIGTMNEFLSPKDPKKHILYNNIGQTIKKIIKNK